MPDDEQVDPWADAHTAHEERLAGLPPRAMLTRAKAMAKADALLRAEGSPDVAVTATPNPLQGLWIVGHRNPQRPDDLIVGGGPLVVPTSETRVRSERIDSALARGGQHGGARVLRFGHGESCFLRTGDNDLRASLSRVTGTSCFRPWRRSARQTTSSRRRPRLSLPSS